LKTIEYLNLHYDFCAMVKAFRIVALLEGLSYIALLLFATPYKYLADDPQFVKMFGMPHGLLFVVYIILAMVLKSEQNWNRSKTIQILLAAIIPFGTFYIDKKYFSANASE